MHVLEFTYILKLNHIQSLCHLQGLERVQVAEWRMVDSIKYYGELLTSHLSLVLSEHLHL